MKWRFGLRHLFVGICVVGGALGWFAWRERIAHKEHVAVKLLQQEYHAIAVYGDGTSDNPEIPHRDWSQIRYGRIHEPVTYLFIPGARIDNSASDLIADLRYLKSLKLQKCEIAPSVRFSRIVLPSVNELSLDETRLCKAQIEGIAALPLAKLELYRAGLTDESLKSIGLQTSLESLALGGDRISDKGVEYLAGLSKLKYLGLQNVRISDRAAVWLVKLQQLEVLDLSGTDFGDAGLEQLSGLSRLEVLRLNDTGVSDRALSVIPRLKRLRYLYLGGNVISDDGLLHLGNARALVGLDLSETQITDRGLEYLKRIPTLNTQSADVRDTRVTKAGKERFQRTDGN
jgi:Leucine-rich repeat (LRR) protein